MRETLHIFLSEYELTYCGVITSKVSQAALADWVKLYLEGFDENWCIPCLRIYRQELEIKLEINEVR